MEFNKAGLSIGDFVDSEACHSAIEKSIDSDGDRRMDPESYIDFVKAYGPENLLEGTIIFEELPLLLINNFFLLACLCETEADNECCVGPKAGIETYGAFSGDTPTDNEKSYLYLVCSQTGIAIDRVIQSMSPSQVPVGTLGPTRVPVDGFTIEKEVIVDYMIGVKRNDSTFEDYNEELISAMDSMAPTLLPEARKRELRAVRNLQSVFLPTTIIDHTTIGESNASTFTKRCTSTRSCVLISLYFATVVSLSTTLSFPFFHP